MTMKRSKAGFTLVEIMTVLAVVGVLATLLFAVLGRVKSNGLSATCQNNLKQIGLAMQQYVADYNGTYPQQEYQTKTGFVIWTDVLQPYIKSQTVFDCPAQPKSAEVNLGYLYNFYQLNEYRYANGQLHSPRGRLEAALPSASELVVSFDVFDKDPLSKEPKHFEVVQGACGRKVPAVNLHSGGANFVYADGHVKWLSTARQQEIGCDLYHDPAQQSPK